MSSSRPRLTPTLDAACYQSDEFWQAERERIWFATWVMGIAVVAMIGSLLIA